MHNLQYKLFTIPFPLLFFLNKYDLELKILFECIAGGAGNPRSCNEKLKEISFGLLCPKHFDVAF